MTDFDFGRLMDRAEWTADANCLGVDPAIFYFQSTTNRRRPPDPVKLARAKAICRECDVQAECLAYALNNNEEGVWGGTSEQERRDMQRRRRQPRPIEHGTPNGYAQHRRAGIPACDACLVASAVTRQLTRPSRAKSARLAIA